MTRYGKEDHIEEDASLAEAVPKLIHSKLHNLVVTAQGTTVGILRHERRLQPRHERRHPAAQVNRSFPGVNV